MRSRKLLLVHHFPLSSVTGVTILLAELLKLIPALDPGIEVAYQHYDGFADAAALERVLDADHADAACVLAVNLQIEVQWELSVALARWGTKRSLPLFNYVQDYWPHHEQSTRELAERHGVRLVGASPFIIDSLAADNFKAALLPMGAQIPAICDSAAPASPKIIASIGRLVRRKRFPDVVRAFRTANLGNSAQLRLVLLPSRVFGKSDDAEQLRLVRQEMGDGSSIHIDMTPAVPPAYSAMAIYVAASAYEGFGMMPFEAAYCGCPPIVSDIPPHKLMAGALFGERAEDFLYPVTQTDALAERLRDEITTGRRRAFLQTRQRQVRDRIESEFSVRTTARALIRLFHESAPAA